MSQADALKFAVPSDRVAQCVQMCALPHALTDPSWPEETTVPLFYSEQRLRLSPTALQFLLARADVIVEGSTVKSGSARGRFLGSAMLTLDLAAAADRLRPPHDAATLAALHAALVEDPEARARIVEHALVAARARLATPSALVAGELQMRTSGTRLLVDLELGSP